MSRMVEIIMETVDMPMPQRSNFKLPIIIIKTFKDKEL